MKVCRISDSLQEREGGPEHAARMAEQLCKGLQIPGPGCKSRSVLHPIYNSITLAVNTSPRINVTVMTKILKAFGDSSSIPAP